MSKVPIRFLREAVRDAMAQGLRTRMLLLVVALACAATVGSHTQHLAQRRELEAAAASLLGRTIRLSAENDAPLFTDGMIRSLASFTDVQQVVALGPIEDARNPAVPEPRAVAVRSVAVAGAALDAIKPSSTPDGVGYATAGATKYARLLDGVGALVGAHRVVEVVGRAALDERFSDYQTTVFVPEPSQPDGWAVVIVTVEKSSSVQPVARLAAALTDDAANRPIQVRTWSDAAASLEELAVAQRRRARPALLVAIGFSAVLVGAVASSSAAARRRDFGRRRAIGATRAAIVALVVGGYGLPAFLSAAAGTALGVTGSMVAGWPLPSSEFVAAIAVVETLIVLLAVFAPAVRSARRDPVRELRVP